MDKNEMEKRAEMRMRPDYYHLQIFVYGMPTSTLFLEYMWLHDPLQNEPFNYYISLIFSIFFYCMAIYSYNKCVTIKNITLPRSPPSSNFPEVIDQAYKNEKNCKTCKYWQPVRAIHCSSCGVCITKHDHHCPWIFNCVGYQNHKAFFLFCTYLMFGSAQYNYRSFKFILYLWEHWDQTDYSFFFYIYWIMNTIVIFSMMFMFIGLSGFHFALAMNNLTSADNLSAYSLRFPCIPDSFYENQNSKVNIYDQGWIANLANFFGNNIFSFWMPLEVNPKSDGNEFPLNPPCFHTEFSQYNEKSVIETIIDVEEFTETVEKKFKENSFQINEKIFEHWKKFSS